MGIKIMCGTDSGNSLAMPYGELHAHEAEVLVRYGGYTPMEAIVASTHNNAYAVGLENDLGTIEAGRLADIIILDKDPLKDIRVLQGGKNLVSVIKDGRMVDLDDTHEEEAERKLILAQQ